MGTVKRGLNSTRAQLETVEKELDRCFTLMDTLYSQILDEAFRDFSPKQKGWEDRLSILHTFLCTAEQTSTSVVADLDRKSVVRERV